MPVVNVTLLSDKFGSKMGLLIKCISCVFEQTNTLKQGFQCTGWAEDDEDDYIHAYCSMQKADQSDNWS